LVWVCVGLGGGTLLAVLAKANGALLPLYALAIECTLLTRRPLAAGAIKRIYRAAMLLLAVVPGMAVVAYVVWTGVRGIVSGDMGVRAWTVGQRLLTEPRVLWDYLSLLWLPRPFSRGLFNDQFVASTSLFHPATTLPALLGVLLLIAGAWWLRRRHPALALAVLFYFAGQLIESSSLPLELYFEHRNYVPALLMFWPLALWLADTRQLVWPKVALMLALPLGLAVMTHARAEVWGNPRTQALLWAQINPHSPRAQANAAQIEIAAGQPRAALRRLQPLLAAEPAQAQLAFNWIDARCVLGEVTPADIAMTRQAMRTTANPGALLTSWFERKLPEVAAGDCHGLTLNDLRGLIDAGLENPKLAGAGRQQDLWYARGRIALLQLDPDAALSAFTTALDRDLRPGIALQAAATLGAAGYPTRGLQLLDHYEQRRQAAPASAFGMPMLHAWVLAHQDYWPHEIAHLRRQLELDVTADKANTAHLPTVPSTMH
ncbi:MAG: tetratricopeptide repeat protein, partial [Rhodanobacter sp.]